jgi:L-asparaginase
LRSRVCVAYTGGTIGMAPTPHGYAPSAGSLRELITSLVAEAGPELPEVEFVELDPPIDSSNATPETWSRIAETVFERRDQFDGFVILHGTDTMAYTASALSLLLPGFGKPVVVTGSQVPLCVARSDGRQNLIGSLQVAAQGDVREVCLLFGSKVLRGNRATKVDASGLEAFDSPSLPPLARLGVEIEVDRRIPAPAPAQPQLLGCGRSHVAAISLFPGIEASVLENLCRPPLQGLVIEAYGAGNGPSDDPAFVSAIETATAAGVVVVIVTQCLHGTVSPGAYATGSAMLAAGAVPGYDLTSEAALTKLAVLLGEGLAPDEVRNLITTDLAGELTVASAGSAR